MAEYNRERDVDKKYSKTKWLGFKRLAEVWLVILFVYLVDKYNVGDWIASIYHSIFN